MAIAHEFHDIIWRLQEDIFLFVVMGELQLHARHAQEVRSQMERLDIGATCLAVMVPLKGITLQAATGARLDDLARASSVIEGQLAGYLVS